jgi:hypothetical protein
MLKYHFRKLNFVPIGPREVQDVWDHRDAHEKETQVAVQNVYRKHGWPDMARSYCGLRRTKTLGPMYKERGKYPTKLQSQLKA